MYTQKEERTHVSEAEAQLHFAQGIIPLVLKSSVFGSDVEYAGWRLFLFIIDHKLGNERFKRLVTEYIAERARM